MNDIIHALVHLTTALANRNIKPPAFITLDPESLDRLKELFGGVATERYAAQGLPVTEIFGIRFTSVLPDGRHWPNPDGLESRPTRKRRAGGKTEIGL